MKRFLLRLLGFALVVGALGLALAPVGIRQYRLWRDAQAAAAYLEAVDALDDAECGALRSMALRYDAALTGDMPTDPLAPETPPASDEAYLQLMDPAGNGVMAVLELPKLGVTLPVYHGAASEMGVGHLENSGMPVDGAGNDCVLAARGNGWLSGPLAGLDRLLPGDRFTIRSLRDTLTYEVTRVSTTLSEALAGQDGDAQACVLMTTAGGARDERVCVRGTRVNRHDVTPRDDSQAVAAWPSRLIFAAPVAAVGLIWIWLAESVRRAARRRRAKRIRL